MAIKCHRCVASLKTTQRAFSELSATMTPVDMERWTREEEDALQTGGDALKVYTVNLEHGKCMPCTPRIVH